MGFNLSEPWKRLRHHILKFLPGNIVELYIWLGMRVKATELLDSKFDKLAPKPMRIISGNNKATKWDMMGACQFLLSLKPEFAVVILNQWSNNEKFKSVAFRAGAILNMMLTLPPPALGFKDKEDELNQKVGQIVTFVTTSNKDLLKNRFETGPVNASVRILELAAAPPAIIPFLANDISELAPFFLLQLQNKNPDRFQFLFEKLPVGKVREFTKKMNDIRLMITETQVKLGSLEHKNAEKEMMQKIGKKDENIGKLADKLSELLEIWIQSGSDGDSGGTPPPDPKNS
jgi:hypothetical protein